MRTRLVAGFSLFGLSLLLFTASLVADEPSAAARKDSPPSASVKAAAKSAATDTKEVAAPAPCPPTQKIKRPKPQATVQLLPAPTDQETQILAALDKQVSVDTKGKTASIKKIVSQMAKLTKIPIGIEYKVFEDLKIAKGHSLAMTANNVTLRAALAILCNALHPEATWYIRNDEMLISIKEQRDNHLITKLYDVADLCMFVRPDCQVRYDFDPLLNTIENGVDPNGWQDAGGQSVMSEVRLPGIVGLSVKTSHQKHRKIAHLLIVLRSLQRSGWDDTIVRPTQDATPRSPVELAIDAALKKRVSMDVKDQPLAHVAAYLSRQLGVNIQIDDQVRKELADDNHTNITISFKDVDARLALRKILAPRGDLYMFLVKNDVLRIISSQAEEAKVTRYYDVFDLCRCLDKGRPGLDMMPPIDLIDTNIEMNAWDEGSNGPQQIDGMSVMALAYTTTDEYHRQIEQLLTATRSSKNPACGLPQCYRSFDSREETEGDQDKEPGADQLLLLPHRASPGKTNEST